MEELKLYKVSADQGNSWTEQWLTEEEARLMSMSYMVKEVKE